jgi:acyl-[acyl-carrier-protein] desaturase
MIVYTMIQERVTQLNYINLRKIAIARGDGALACVLKLIAADEAAHYTFFRDGVKLLMRYSKDEMIDRLKNVFRTFKMPALSLIPEIDSKTEMVNKLGVYGLTDYYKSVYLPVLAELELSVEELKYLKAPKASIEKAAKREEMKNSYSPVFSISTATI